VEYNKEIKNRLKRIEGQVRGVLRMIDQEEGCKEVVTQLSAARSALDRTIALIVAANLENCLRVQMKDGGNQASSDLIKEAVQLLVKSR
jgi:DNA-binding FrmR family transcriptional regulator